MPDAEVHNDQHKKIRCNQVQSAVDNKIPSDRAAQPLLLDTELNDAAQPLLLDVKLKHAAQSMLCDVLF